MQAYRSASQEVWLDGGADGALKLDWNESTVAHEIVREEVSKFLAHPGVFNWYPDVGATRLTEELATFIGCDTNEVLTFGGSDVALETICRTYLMPGDVTIAVRPGYDHFRVYAEACGSRVVQVQPGDNPFAFSVGDFLKRIRGVEGVKVIYLIHPNNPAGYCLELKDIELILNAFPDAAVIVDEAYVEFAGNGTSCAAFVPRHDNVYVTRSLSKAFALAGLRLGYVISAATNIANLAKIRNPKNVSMIAQVAGVALLEHTEVVLEHVRKVCEAREWLVGALRQRGCMARSTHANFVLVHVRRPEEAIGFLKSKGIYVRDRSHIPGLEGTIRITVGYLKDMERVVRAFESMPPSMLQPALEEVARGV